MPKFTPFYKNWIYRAEMKLHTFTSREDNSHNSMCFRKQMVWKSTYTHKYVFCLVWLFGIGSQLQKPKVFSHEFLTGSAIRRTASR